jgi:hypothetical protein
VRFHKGFRLRTANKDENCSSAYGRRVSGFFKPRILEELPTLQKDKVIAIQSRIFRFLARRVISITNSLKYTRYWLARLLSRKPFWMVVAPCLSRQEMLRRSP